MLLDFSQGSWDDYPYDGFDARGLSICSEDFKAFLVDTESGKVTGKVRLNEYDSKDEVRQFTPPIRVIGGSGKEVTLGKVLKKRRKELGLRLHHVAERSGLSLGYISSIERGKNQPTLTALRQLMVALEGAIELNFREVERCERFSSPSATTTC